MLMGTYERAGKPWSEHSTPWDFGSELLPEDIDRIAPSLEVGFSHFPALQNAGIRKIVNGPFTFAPDGNPLVGPIRNMPGYWVACGVMAGFSQGGGVGHSLANWMVDGDPGFDVFAMDVARFGEFATPRYTNARVRENYGRRFSIRFPNEELTAGRPLRTTPIYDRLHGVGAQFGAAAGIEVPLWFAPEGVSDAFSFRRSTDFPYVAKEVQAVRQSVGLSEISQFAKYSISGPGAAGWLDRVLACRLPKPGRMTLAPMLKHDGGVIGDFTLANIDDREFFLAGSGVAEEYHRRWFEQLMPKDGSVQLTVHQLGYAGLAVAGPRSRDLLAKLTSLDLSNHFFPFMAVRDTCVAMAPARVGRVSYTGDLGYELWMKPDYQRHIFDALMDAGAEFGVKCFGSRALNALRLEKNYGGWLRDYRPIYGPLECGLDRFVAYDKASAFIGKEAANQEKRSGGRYRLRNFVIESIDADPIGDEPIFHRGQPSGWITSGGFAHGSGVSMAMGIVPRALSDEDDGWEIELLGQRLPAVMQHHPLFDANGSRMRS